MTKGQNLTLSIPISESVGYNIESMTVDIALSHPRVKSIRAVLGYVWSDSTNDLETNYYLDTTNNAQIVLFDKIGSNNLSSLGNIFDRRALKEKPSGPSRPTVDTYFTLSDTGKPLS